MSSDPFAASAQLEGVPSAFVSTRDGIDALLRDRGLRRSSPEMTGESLLRGAAATARLEGSDVDVEQLRAGEGDATARAAVRLSSELLALVPVWQKAPLQALARIHTLAAYGSSEDVELGRPVKPEGAARLNQLSRLVQQTTTAPGLVVASLVHAEVLVAAAFFSHNGVVARAAERLVLVVKGVDPASVTVPEAGHAAEPFAYRDAMFAYARGTTEGVHQWLLYAADAFARGAEATPPF